VTFLRARITCVSATAQVVNLIPMGIKRGEEGFVRLDVDRWTVVNHAGDAFAGLRSAGCGLGLVEPPPSSPSQFIKLSMQSPNLSIQFDEA
jgi:hypothetical protein